MKNKIVGFLIFLFTLLVPFKIAFLRDDIQNGFVSALALVVMLAGSIAGAYFFINEPLGKKSEH
jgi:L-lactate permease